MRNNNRTNNDISALSCQIRIQDCSSNNITTQKHFKIHKCKSEASHRRQDDTMIKKILTSKTRRYNDKKEPHIEDKTIQWSKRAAHRRQDDTMINKDSDPQNTTQKTNGKDWTKRGCEFRCLGKANIPCSTSGTNHATHLLSFVTTIFYNVLVVLCLVISILNSQ